MPQRDPWVFVSYANAPPQHKHAVREFVKRLSTKIRCVIDEDIERTGPPDGHAAWSRKQIATATYVLIVCSAEYGTGRGSQWEWKLVQNTLYNDGGLNYRFIPIVLQPSDEQYVPDCLLTANRYCVSDATGYDRLIAHVLSGASATDANSPQGRGYRDETAHVSLSDSDDNHRVDAENVACLLSLPDGRYRITWAERIIRGARGEVEVHASPRRDQELGFLRSIRDQMEGRIGLAYQDVAFQFRLRSVRPGNSSGLPWVIALQEEPAQWTAGPQERRRRRIPDLDRIAELRARRILLNDQLDPAEPGYDVLEDLVRGCEIPCDFEVLRSPLVELYAHWRGNPADFLEEARLAAVHQLHLSGTVEHVLLLELTWAGAARVAVNFKGQRPRHYRNADPDQIEIRGECQLL